MNELYYEDNDDFLLIEAGENDLFDLLPQVKNPEYYHREKGGRRRKRRCQNPRFMPEIRIFRRDIRRKYGEMLMNVANAHDLSLLEKFLNDLFRPDCQVIRTNPPPNGISKAVSNLVFTDYTFGYMTSGIKEIIQEYSYHCDMVPDSVFLLQESSVRVKQGFGGSIIMAKILSKGTQTWHIESKKSSMVPVSPPIESVSETMFILVLDDLHRVQQFHIETLNSYEKPVTQV